MRCQAKNARGDSERVCFVSALGCQPGLEGRHCIEPLLCAPKPLSLPPWARLWQSLRKVMDRWPVKSQAHWLVRPKPLFSVSQSMGTFPIENSIACLKTFSASVTPTFVDPIETHAIRSLILLPYHRDQQHHGIHSDHSVVHNQKKPIKESSELVLTFPQNPCWSNWCTWRVIDQHKLNLSASYTIAYRGTEYRGSDQQGKPNQEHRAQLPPDRSSNFHAWARASHAMA